MTEPWLKSGRLFLLFLTWFALLPVVPRASASTDDIIFSTLGTPTIDGKLSEPLWQNAIEIVLKLYYHDHGLHPSDPPFDLLNGCLMVANNDEYLFLGLQFFNITRHFDLMLCIDDRTNDTTADETCRGAVFSRSETRHWTARQLARVTDPNGTQWWAAGFHYDGFYENNQYIQWEIVNETSGLQYTYATESAFKFRSKPGDPSWLPERVETLGLYISLEIEAELFLGMYQFPPDGAFFWWSEGDLVRWLQIRCAFGTPTPTTPLGPLTCPIIILAPTLLVGLSVGAYLHRRRRLVATPE